MTTDQFHIEMEDISPFPLERSADYSSWEETSFEELKENILVNLPEEKKKYFLEWFETAAPSGWRIITTESKPINCHF